MSPLREALCDHRRSLSPDAEVTLRILTPPYPCAGTGVLRVVRAIENGKRIEVTAAYEGYDRLERPA